MTRTVVGKCSLPGRIRSEDFRGQRQDTFVLYTRLWVTLSLLRVQTNKNLGYGSGGSRTAKPRSPSEVIFRGDLYSRYQILQFSNLVANAIETFVL
jgi:hypothetical protein